MLKTTYNGIADNTNELQKSQIWNQLLEHATEFGQVPDSIDTKPEGQRAETLITLNHDEFMAALTPNQLQHIQTICKTKNNDSEPEQRFSPNADRAFIIAMKRPNKNDTPKLCKSDNTLYYDEEEAFNKCKEYNKQADPEGTVETFAVFEVDVCIRYQHASREQYLCTERDKTFLDPRWVD